MADDVASLSKAFKALANPNRLRIFLNLLRETELRVSAGHDRSCFLAPLMESLNVGAPTVSHHVKELVNAGLIHTERQGKQLVCTVNATVLARLREVLS